MLRFHIGCLPDPHLAMPHAFFNPLQCLERAGREAEPKTEQLHPNKMRRIIKCPQVGENATGMV